MSERRRAKMARRSPPADAGVTIPAELRHCPKTGPVSEYIAWRERRKAFARKHGLLDGRGAIDWRKWTACLHEERPAALEG